VGVHQEASGEQICRLILYHKHSDPTDVADLSARARFILVDEYQGTSQSQYTLIKGFTGRERNITCVGSPAQAIYARRGADPEFLLRMFRRD